MWDLEHQPAAAMLATRYQLEYTSPAQCAVNVLSGAADLGLIPIAALTPQLAIVPGCAIASLDRVRSIQLIIKQPHTLATLRTVAADTASLSSIAYAQVLFRKFLGTEPQLIPAAANPITMLQQADAALLIGDPALLALEHRDQIESAVGPCDWHDLAHEWTSRTGLPWIAAVWAVRPESLAAAGISAQQLAADLIASRDHGLAHIEDLVQEWAPRIALPPATIRDYFTRNIHYTLDDRCLAAIRLFRQHAAEAGILPPLPTLHLL